MTNLHGPPITLFVNGDMDRAIADAEAAKGLEQTNSDFQAHLCGLLESTRQFDAALEVANRLVEMQPNHVGALRRRGHVHCQLKKYEMAIADYEKALELEPSKLKLKLARLGAEAASGQVETNRNELNRLIAEADNPGKVLVDYGLAIYRAGLLEQMEWAVEKSAQFGTSTESIMHYNLGCGYALAGDSDRAFAALNVPSNWAKVGPACSPTIRT